MDSIGPEDLYEERGTVSYAPLCSREISSPESSRNFLFCRSN
jgi:hypothetical protein